MNIKDYYEKKKELEYLITYNERIHCPRVAEKGLYRHGTLPTPTPRNEALHRRGISSAERSLSQESRRF